MKKFVIAILLIIIGCAIFVGVMAKLEWDFTALSTVDSVTNEYEITESYNNIYIDVDTADVRFVPSECEKTRIVCHEWENTKHTVSVKDGTLVIELADEREWYEGFDIKFGKTEVIVYLPSGNYGALNVDLSTGDVDVNGSFGFESIEISTSTGDVKNRASAETVKIDTTTGNIYVENITCDLLFLSVTTGDVEVRNAKCNTFDSDGTTGELYMSDVIAETKISIERNTGDIRFDRCDSGEIYIDVTTGNVNGSLLTDKIFITDTSSGKIDIPSSASGGVCKISTTTGNIKITIE